MCIILITGISGPRWPSTLPADILKLKELGHDMIACETSASANKRKEEDHVYHDPAIPRSQRRTSPTSSSV